MTGLETGLLVAVVVTIALVASLLTWQLTRLRRRLIAIEILNPLELAASESRFAKHLGGVAPTMIRREVTKRTVAELALQLREKGVNAEVRVHDAD